jgi:Protein of unknown function (DUF3592)
LIEKTMSIEDQIFEQQWDAAPCRPPETPTRQVKGLLAVLVGLVVVGFAGFINWWYFDMLVAHEQMRSWQEVPAKIVEAGIRSHSHSRGGTTQRATATYTYQFAGRTYTGHRVTWDTGSDNMGSFQGDTYRKLEAHRASKRPLPCFVDPADPASSILFRDLRPEILVMISALELWIGLPLVIVISKWLWSKAIAPLVLWPGPPADVNPFAPGQSAAATTDSPAGSPAESPRAKALSTTIAAIVYNALTIPLFVYLPKAPQGTFWPWVFGLLLAAIGWLIAWQAVMSWFSRARVSKLAILPRDR